MSLSILFLFAISAISQCYRMVSFRQKRSNMTRNIRNFESIFKFELNLKSLLLTKISWCNGYHIVLLILRFVVRISMVPGLIFFFQYWSILDSMSDLFFISYFGFIFQFYLLLILLNFTAKNFFWSDLVGSRAFVSLRALFTKPHRAAN